MDGDRLPIGNRDSCCLLSAVLERVQTEEGHARHVFVRRKDPNHAALFTRSIIREHGRSPSRVQAFSSDFPYFFAQV